MSIGAVIDPVARGDEALVGGDWQGARAAFEAAVADAPAANAYEGLARALWWLHDTDAAVANMERAYAAYREEPDPRRAAACALWLAREFSAAYGHDAVSGAGSRGPRACSARRGTFPNKAGSP